MPDGCTQGRCHFEEPHPYRSEYQRDRDRIVHTKAFRRLEHKTQVFNPDYSDHFRNRLTHTLEVSQITRTISDVMGLNTDLCEVLALSHDIGHPPFSHEGEKILGRMMEQYGSGFDHNLHALRIVEDFEEKYPSFRGLNLTFEVREGIIKHSRDYNRDEVVYVDISEYRLEEFPPLEAQIIDLADEIAYNSADLDDGYDSGLLTLEQMVEGLELFGSIYREVEICYPRAKEKLRVRETVRRIIDTLVTSLTSHTRGVLESEGIDSVQKVRSCARRIPSFSQDIGELNRELKIFLRRFLYDHQIIGRSRVTAQRLLVDLFEFYLENPRQLPERHFSRIPILGPERVVCDYIAGMTDKYAQSRHSSLFKHLKTGSLSGG